MSKYTEILEFFMENGVQLDRERLEELKAVTEATPEQRDYADKIYMKNANKKDPALKREDMKRFDKATDDNMSIGCLVAKHISDNNISGDEEKYLRRKANEKMRDNWDKATTDFFKEKEAYAENDERDKKKINELKK